jgi:hypothetical protein
MYASVAAESGSVVVGVYSGPDTDADHARAIASIVAADAAAVANDEPVVVILVTQRDSASPPPIWRKRMADANQNMRAKAYYFALVSPNGLLRGVLTAINWLNDVPSHHHFEAKATFDEAARWIRKETAGSYPMLESLYERAQRALGHG